jgi:hypothetical protein
MTIEVLLDRPRRGAAPSSVVHGKAVLGEPVADGGRPGDAVAVELAGLLARLERLGDPDAAVTSAARIDRIALLEQVKAAAAGAQSAEMVQFAVGRVEEQRSADVHPRSLGRGIAGEIALACHVSPAAGSRRLTLARALWFDLPETYAALRCGRVSEWVATLVSRETSHLDAQRRRDVDAQLAKRDLGSLSPRQAAGTARGLAYRADPLAAVERARTEEKERRVTVRPAPDTMAILTAYLPAAQAIAAYAALGREADSTVATGDRRTRGQIMADTLVQRVTGQAQAGDVSIEIGLVMPVDTLTQASGTRPAELLGYGPLPAPLARELLRSTKGELFLRRLFAAPRTASGGGQIIGGDDRRRRFTGALAQLVTARDQHCRDPFCDAPIRHLDHITRHSEQGTTTLANGRGVCARGNYTREMPGWQVKLLDTGLAERPHTIAVTTPTGHTYVSRAPDPP